MGRPNLANERWQKAADSPRIRRRAQQRERSRIVEDGTKALADMGVTVENVQQHIADNDIQLTPRIGETDQEKAVRWALIDLNRKAALKIAEPEPELLDPVQEMALPHIRQRELSYVQSDAPRFIKKEDVTSGYIESVDKVLKAQTVAEFIAAVNECLSVHSSRIEVTDINQFVEYAHILVSTEDYDALSDPDKMVLDGLFQGAGREQFEAKYEKHGFSDREVIPIRNKPEPEPTRFYKRIDPKERFREKQDHELTTEEKDNRSYWQEFTRISEVLKKPTSIDEVAEAIHIVHTERKYFNVIPLITHENKSILQPLRRFLATFTIKDVPKPFRTSVEEFCKYNGMKLKPTLGQRLSKLFSG